MNLTAEARMHPIAVDYGRFSNMVQEVGDSKRRQQSLPELWSARTGVPIDLQLYDEGVSGRLKARRTDECYALAQFLKMIQTGRVRAGDYLLLENFDRLSREQEVPATHLLTSILVAGIIVVQLAPVEIELTAHSDAFTIFRAVMELARGHGESERKHQLCSASYAGNRAAVADGKESYQGALPAWLRRAGEGKGAKHRPIEKLEDRAAIVRQIFGWAAAGLGYTRIVRRLVAEKIPPFGDRAPRLDPATNEQAKTRRGRLRWVKVGDDYGTGRWTRSYVVSLIQGREVLGELPTKTGGTIRVPAIMEEDEWLAAQAGRAERQKHRGRSRVDGQENLFGGLLVDAFSGDTFYSVTRQGRGRKWRVLVNASGKECSTTARSFPEPIFEAAIRSRLREVKIAEVLEQQTPDKVVTLSNRLERVRGRLVELSEEVKGLERLPKGIGRAMADLEEEETRLEEERRDAQIEARHPLSETWGQAQSLLDVDLTPEQRLRLRTLLRRLVEEIRVLIVPRGWDRVAVVQIRFCGSTLTRCYVITYRKDVMPDGSKASRRKRQRGKDVATVSVFRRETTLDLRDPAHVEALRAELAERDLSAESTD